MYKLIRNTHLILGLLSVSFVLTYAMSAVQMAHRIPIAPQVTEEDVALQPGLAPRSVAEALMQQRGYGGELGNPQPQPGGFRVTIGRPGRVFTVRYESATGQAHVRRETRSFLGMLNRLHHQNGLHHQDGRLNAWGWALALVSVVFLVLGATGVYLWFRMHKERAIGAVLLGANLVVSLALLRLLRA
jgi:hypothetical protein